ncbi:MAG: MFS transporter, partial [Aestuariivirgaceae bacterium]|nr:MFS transporter [Aestuariivirgaceae bacterium]
LVLLVLFWHLNLEVGARRASSVSSHPWRSVRRFVAQPRLRLAWMVAFSRSCFWTVFFTYAPLLLLTSGLSAKAGGLLVSLGNVTLVTALLFGKLAQRVGVRRVIAGAMVVSAVLSLFAGLSGLAAMPVLAAVLLWLATFAASALDGVGGIPFLRSVRVHERAEMSGVYRTYLDFSELLPNIIFSVALLMMPIAGVFIILAAWLVLAGWISWRFLPRSM